MIGVYGGTFDPVHFGHLRPALEVYRHLGLAELRLVPAGVPPHREIPGADARARLAMLALAVGDQPGFRIDTRELDRPGESYMVDTLASLREEVGDTPLCLVLGVDAAAALDRWHRWEALAELAHLVVMARPGARLPDGGAVARLAAARRVGGPADLARRPAGGWYDCPVTHLDISATAIREQLAAGGDPRFLLPDPVLDYIRSHGLYQAPSS